MMDLDGKSLDITDERLNKLKEILPDAFTEGKIDWEKLQATLGEDIEFKNERYVLNWAGKTDAFPFSHTSDRFSPAHPPLSSVSRPQTPQEQCSSFLPFQRL